MAKKQPTKPATVEPPKGDALNKEFTQAQTSMLQFRTKWEELLDTAYARLVKESGFKSRVREGTLSNLLWERAARVVAQMPTGKVQALNTKSDIGKSKLMDIVWHKYVLQFAGYDYSFFTQLRMWDYYSMVYGACPAYYDYDVSDDYVGPNWAVLDPRYVFPQAGRLSFKRCQFHFVEAYHNKEYIQGKVDVDGWDTPNLNKILAEWKDDVQADNTRRLTNLQNDRGQSIDLHKGEIQLVTKYEKGKKGHWVTFAPQYDNMVVRDIPNPHKSGKIPIVWKFCFPLLDSAWGMGDVERGQSLQLAIDSFINLSMDFAKFKLYPPQWYTDGTNVSQLRYEPGAKWKVPNKDATGFMEISGNYSEEMANGYQFLSGALQRQNGTTQTNIASGDSDPSQGKTPQAIEKNTANENARDNWDRNMLEEAYSELANGMINLIGTKQPASIEFHIFDDDIKKIYDANGKDVLEIFDSAKKPKITEDGQLDWELNGKGAAKVTAGVKDLAGVYKFVMDPNTTMATDDQKEYERLKEIGMMIATPEGQQMIASLQQDKRSFNSGAFFKKLLIASGTSDWEEIIPEIAPEAGVQQFNPSMLQDPQSQQMLQQSQGQPGMPLQPGQLQQAPRPDPQAMQQEVEKRAQELVKQQGKAPSEMISYKDASPLTKAHMEEAAGFTPDPIHELEERAAMAGHTAGMINQAMPQPVQPTEAKQPQGATNG